MSEPASQLQQDLLREGTITFDEVRRATAGTVNSTGLATSVGAVALPASLEIAQIATQRR